MSSYIAQSERTKQILRKHQLSLKKSLGQNFLTDLQIIQQIVAAANIGEDDAVLEIGPGIGALTEHLAAVANRLVAVELDQRLVPILKELFEDKPNVCIEHGDFLKIDLQKLFSDYFQACRRIHVVANLPYYVTTPIIMRLLEASLPLTSIVVMVQKEVADRMAAVPGSKTYGSLSVAVQYYCDIEQVLKVPAAVFIPAPNVDSAVIRLSVLPEPRVQVKRESFFFEVVRASFAQRRKTLINNLHAKFKQAASKQELEQMIKDCGISPQIRGEALSLAEFARLSDQLLSSLHQA